MGIVGGLPSPPPKWDAQPFDVSTITNESVTVSHNIWENSEFVILNGLVLTNGVTYDYTIINDNEIKFNSGVLTNDGHVLIKYTYQ